MTKREAKRYISVTRKIDKMHKALISLRHKTETEMLCDVIPELRRKIADAGHELWRARRIVLKPLMVDWTHGYSYSELKEMLV